MGQRINHQPFYCLSTTQPILMSGCHFPPCEHSQPRWVPRALETLDAFHDDLSDIQRCPRQKSIYKALSLIQPCKFISRPHTTTCVSTGSRGHRTPHHRVRRTLRRISSTSLFSRQKGPMGCHVPCAGPLNEQCGFHGFFGLAVDVSPKTKRVRSQALISASLRLKFRPILLR